MEGSDQPGGEHDPGSAASEEGGGHPRGVVEAEVGGDTYLLRAALSLDGKLLERTDRSFYGWAEDLATMQSPADLDVQGLLVMFEELCAAGGERPPDGWRDELLLGDLEEVIYAAKKALVAAGLLEEGPAPDELQTSGEGEKGG